MDDLNLKAKLKAIVNIINEMDDMELNDMAKEEEPKKEGITMVSIKAKPSNEDTMEENEPPENTAKDQMEDVAEGEAPETEEEADPNSVLGRLRKRLQGSI